MKKFYTTFLIAIFTLSLFASVNINDPALTAPADNATNQMPDVLLDWAPVSAGYGLYYKVQVCTDSLFSAPIVLTSTLSAIKATELSFGQKYYWRVKAYDNADSSGWSSVRSFTVISKVTLKPMNANSLQCYVAGDSITWEPVTGISHYMYQLDTIPSFTSTFLKSDTLPSTAKSYVFPQEIYSNLTYYFRIKAIHSQSVSLWSNTATIHICNTIPNTPVLKSPANLSVNQPSEVVIKWYPLTGAGKYDIEYADNINFNNSSVVNFTIINSNIYFEPNSTDTLTGLSLNTTYYWRVRAIQNNITTLWSEPWSFTTADSVPVQVLPADLATNVTPTVQLTWTAGYTASSYIVSYADNPAFTGAVNGTSTNPNLTVNNLKFNTSYYWKVRSVTGTDTSSWSATRSFSVVAAPTLLTPANNTLGTDLNVTLNWEIINGSNNYNVQIDTVATFNSTLLGNFTQQGNSIGLMSTLNNITYYWRVKAMHAADTSMWSPVWTLTTIDTMPGIPVLISPADLAVNQAIETALEWTPIQGASTYTFEYGLDPTLTTGTTSLTVSTHTATTTALMYDSTYYWRVKANGTNDTSAWSAIFSFTVLDVPVLLSPADNSTDISLNPELEWEAINGADKYIIEYATDNVFTTPLQLTSTTENIMLTSLPFGAQYFWHVKVIAGTDTSAWSATFNFTTIDNVTLLSPADNAVTPLSVLLTWEPVAGTTTYAYQCQIDTANTFNSALLNNIIIPSDIPVLQAFSSQSLFNTVYFWRVRIINGADTSGWSAVWSFTTQNDVVLALPANLSTGVMPNVSLLSYNMTGVYNYLFELDTVNTFDSFLYYYTYPTANVPYVESTNSELLFGTKYFWRVRGRMGTIFSNWSAIWEFTTIDKVTSTLPANGASLVNTNVDLEWDALEGVTSYTVELDTTAAFSTASTITLTSTINELTVLASTLVSNKTYYWRVKAFHSKDESDWSTVRTFNFSYNVGIENNTSENSILLYPNPTKGQVSLNIHSAKSEEARLTIRDITGRVVYEDALQLNRGHNLHQLNLTQLSQGIYLIAVKNDHINFNKKLILNN